MSVRIVLSALAMTAIVGVRYLLVSGAFAWVTIRKHLGLDPRVRPEVVWSLASAALQEVPAGVVAWGWQQHGWARVYADVPAYPLQYAPVSVLLYLPLQDAWFYWMHRPAPFKLEHALHHASRPPTAWAAMAFRPIKKLSSAVVIPRLVFFVPIHVGGLALGLTIMMVMGVTNPMGWEIFSRFMCAGRLGGWLITANPLQQHYELYGCNYGLYFRHWDRLCGTDGGVGDFAREHARASHRVTASRSAAVE